MQLPATYEELQAAAKYRSLRALLRMSAIQSLPIGCIGILVGILNYGNSNHRLDSFMLLMIIAGIICLIHGFLCLFFLRSWLFLSEVITVCSGSIIACVSIIMLLSSRPERSIKTSIIAGLLFLIGFFFIKYKDIWRQYNQYDDIPQQPSLALMEWINTTVKSIRKLRRENNSSIISFTTYSTRWIALLDSEFAFIMDNSGNEILLLNHTNFSISRPEINPFNKNIGDSRITIDYLTTVAS